MHWARHVPATAEVELLGATVHLTLGTRWVFWQIIQDQLAEGYCYRSHARIAERLGMSRKTVLRACALLTEAKLIFSEPRWRKSESGGRTSNRMVVNWQHAYWRNCPVRSTPDAASEGGLRDIPTHASSFGRDSQKPVSQEQSTVVAAAALVWFPPPTDLPKTVPEPEDPSPRPKTTEPPAHPEEEQVWIHLAQFGLRIRNLEALRWLLLLAIRAGGIELVYAFARWFNDGNRPEPYKSHVAMVRSKFPEFLEWKHRAAAPPPEPEPPPPIGPALRAQCRDAATVLTRPEFRPVLDELKGLSIPDRPPDIQALDDELYRIDEHQAAIALALLTAAQRAEMERAIAKELNQDRARRMTREQLAQRGAAAEAQWARNALGLKRLGLFYLSEREVKASAAAGGAR